MYDNLDDHAPSFPPHPGSALCGRSALEVLRSEERATPIITFSARVDEMLGGGVAPGKITEICGAPGTGKTQFRSVGISAGGKREGRGVGFCCHDNAMLVTRPEDSAHHHLL